MKRFLCHYKGKGIVLFTVFHTSEGLAVFNFGLWETAKPCGWVL
jgi:hypothetical protein